MTESLVQYVLVRGDLYRAKKWPLGAVVAQACHACVAAVHLYYKDEFTEKYLEKLDTMHKVVLEVSDEAELEKLCDILITNNIHHKKWVEYPEEEATCIALKPYPKDIVKDYFKKYKLLSS